MPFPVFWTPKKLTKLRQLYQSGLSMREVGGHFGKSVWAINNAMKRHHIPRRLASITRNHQFINSPLSFSPKTTLTSSEKQLKIAGLMLYWGEGAKKNHNGQINIANADPKMILLFLKFLRLIYCVNESKLRCHLYCFSDQCITEELNYWSDLTNIPTSQFIQPYIATNHHPTHAKIPHGVCHIVYSDKRLFQLILLEIERLQQKLIG